MYQGRANTWRPVYRDYDEDDLPSLPPGALRGITVDPADADVVRPDARGVAPLHAPLRQHFGALAETNRWTGERNHFTGVVYANSVVHTSDPSRKENITEIDPGEALTLVQGIPAYRYNLLPTGRPAAGFLSTEVPAEYTSQAPDNTMAIDYVSMTAHLWAAVQALAAEVESLRNALT